MRVLIVVRTSKYIHSAFAFESSSFHKENNSIMRFCASALRVFVCIRVSRPNTCPRKTEANVCLRLVIRLCMHFYKRSLAIAVIKRPLSDTIQMRKLATTVQPSNNPTSIVFPLRFDVLAFQHPLARECRRWQTITARATVRNHVLNFNAGFQKFILFRTNPDTLICNGPALALLSYIRKKKTSCDFYPYTN